MLTPHRVSTNFHIVSSRIVETPQPDGTTQKTCEVSLLGEVPIPEAKFVYFDVYRDYDCFPYLRKDIELNGERQLTADFSFLAHQEVVFEMFFIGGDGRLIAWADSIMFDTEKGIT